MADPTVPKARPRRSGGMSERTSAVPFGMAAAPEMACTVRATSRTSMRHESAATTVAARKSTSPIRKSLRRP